ncbi:MAG: type II secretion system protein M [Gammaproteobacteria bacterium]|nr:type II secretion system protein M [Gammaproteobacteria bacterium]
MNDRATRLREWLAARSARERRTLRLGAMAAVAVLLLGLLVPLQRGVTARAERVSTLRADLGWLRSMAPRLAAASSLPAASSESLVVLVDRVARATGVASGMSASQQAANGTLDVRLERVPFDALATWLGQLTQANGVQVDSAIIESTGAPGLVRASLVLRQR